MMRRIHSILLTGIIVSQYALAEAPEGFKRGMNAMLEGNFAEAYCQWKPLAQRGHAEAQYNLGWLYANGNGMKVDMKKAFYWWEAAAAQGHADAQFALGLAYTTGESVKRDLGQAAKWFYKAAHRGHLDARESLMRLAGDLDLDLLASMPQLVSEPWFGWTAKVKGDRINVRGGPGTKHRVVAKLKKGQKVRVFGRHGDWLHIQLPNDKDGEPGLAWVYHSLLRPIGPKQASL